MMISEKIEKALSKVAVPAVEVGVSFYVMMAVVLDMDSGAAIMAAVSVGIALLVSCRWHIGDRPLIVGIGFGIGVASGLIAKSIVTFDATGKIT